MKEFKIKATLVIRFDEEFLNDDQDVTLENVYKVLASDKVEYGLEVDSIIDSDGEQFEDSDCRELENMYNELINNMKES